MCVSMRLPLQCSDLAAPLGFKAKLLTGGGGWTEARALLNMSGHHLRPGLSWFKPRRAQTNKSGGTVVY